MNVKLAKKKIRLCKDGLMELYNTEPEDLPATLLGLHQLADEALAALECQMCRGSREVFIEKRAGGYFSDPLGKGKPCPGCPPKSEQPSGELLKSMYDNILGLKARNERKDGSYEVKDEKIAGLLNNLGDFWVLLSIRIEQLEAENKQLKGESPLPGAWWRDYPPKSEQLSGKLTSLGNSIRKISESVSDETSRNIIKQAADRLDCWWAYIQELNERIKQLEAKKGQ